MSRDALCRAFRRRSGSVDSNDPLVQLLYLVLRDHMPAGRLEEILAEALDPNAAPFRFSNGWAAKHAIDAARRLRRGR